MKLYELAGPLLLFGTFANDINLKKTGEQAFKELEKLGYSIESFEKNPVKVYPLDDRLPSARSAHGALFQPGKIFLRSSPIGAFSSQKFLRHEIAHAVAYRHCKGKVPLWIEEAIAISFAGGFDSSAEQPSEDEISRLKQIVLNGAPLTRSSQKTLANLMTIHGQPEKPCEVPKKLHQVLKPAEGQTAFRISSLISGRTFEKNGDQKTSYPIGSLMKIPYVASLSLKKIDHEKIGIGLLRSEEAYFHPFDSDSKLLEQLIGQTSIHRKNHFKEHNGHRTNTGEFTKIYSLEQATALLRSSILQNPSVFSSLSKNGETEGSTLYGQNPAKLKVLQSLNAMTKTGTISSPRGFPILGYLMVAWPAQNPTHLALFRQTGVTGTEVLNKASKILSNYKQSGAHLFPRVSLRVLNQLPRASSHIDSECGMLTGSYNGRKIRYSPCGHLVIHTPSSKVRKKRYYFGFLTSNESKELILNTDHESYVDSVVESEADSLSNETKEVLKPVVLWNGVHGDHRAHSENKTLHKGLCDTTHCGVFLGQAHSSPSKNWSQRPYELFRLLGEITQKRWLMYEKGGHKDWTSTFSISDLRKKLNFPLISLTRNRLRTGQVEIRIDGEFEETSINCELFRNELGLLSCPRKIEYLKAKSAYKFYGKGEGHGKGLNLIQAEESIKNGVNSEAVLRHAYQDMKPNRKHSSVIKTKTISR